MSNQVELKVVKFCSCKGSEVKGLYMTTEVEPVLMTVKVTISCKTCGASITVPEVIPTTLVCEGEEK